MMQIPFMPNVLNWGSTAGEKAVLPEEKSIKACLQHVTFAITVFQNNKSLAGKVSHAVI